MALDGVQDQLNSRNMTEAGAVNPDDSGSEPSDYEDRKAIRQNLPGASRGDKSVRRVKRDIRCKSLQFSPNGRSWAAATTEGLMEYSLDESVVFDPLDLDMELTPDAVLSAVRQL